MAPCKEALTLEHIDPRNGVLVSGLCVEDNEILADGSYNFRKVNRFVPYRVCEYPAPIHPGDLCEFLIDGQWVVCEFAIVGGLWWKESERIGCATNNRKGKKNSEESNNTRSKSVSKLKWWNDGENCVRAIEPPGQGWVRGRLPFMAEEQKAHVSRYTTGAKFWNNGEICVRAKERPGAEWKRGRLPFRRG